MEKSKFFLLLHIIFNAIFVIAHEDEILNLPGLSFKPNFEHYSGFLQVRKNHFLHYWFVTSQRNPASDPLVFWFNGGPGCSSIDGLLNEMGPYTSNEDGTTLSQNPNAWNKYASIVYIEAPAGVGYSYSTDGNVQTDDDQTSTENYEAIKQFFSKHPDYRNRQVFITGESYGGIYIPTLTSRIINGLKEFNINLTGVAIGNGYLNEQLNIETIVRFAYGHGLVDEKVWNTVELECCRGCVDGCDLMQLGGACNKMVQDIYAFSWNGGLNPYDLYRSCDSASLDSSFRTRAVKFGLTPKIFLGVFNTTSPNLSPKNPKNNEKLKEVSVPCLNDTALTHYMNRQEVRKALNIPEELGKWEICSSEISSTYKQIYEDVSSFIKQIINAKVRVLLYYGDTDMACNFLMGQQFADRLGLRPVLKKSPWKFDGQIAGFKTVYEKQLTFLTVKGAGHMAPQWKAPEMAYAFKKFLLNKSI